MWFCGFLQAKETRVSTMTAFALLLLPRNDGERAASPLRMATVAEVCWRVSS